MAYSNNNKKVHLLQLFQGTNADVLESVLNAAVQIRHKLVDTAAVAHCCRHALRHLDLVGFAAKKDDRSIDIMDHLRVRLTTYR